jgi:hypothetical protein
VQEREHISASTWERADQRSQMQARDERRGADLVAAHQTSQALVSIAMSEEIVMYEQSQTAKGSLE